VKRMPHPLIIASLHSRLTANAARMGGAKLRIVEILGFVVILLGSAIGSCRPMPVPTSDPTGTATPSLTSTGTPPPVKPTVALTETPAPTPTTPVLPLPNDSKLTVAAVRIPTSTAVLVKPTAVQTLIAYDRNPRAILVEADIVGGLAPVPREAHVPLFRLYADGFVVFAGEQTPLSTGLDAVVRTGYLAETDIQQLLAFLRDSGFYGLDAYYEPKPVPADLATGHITVNLNKAKTVQVYAPGLQNTPKAFYDAFGSILHSIPETSKTFAPNEGYLVALPAGAVSDFRSKDILAEWSPTVGVRLADAADGSTVSGSDYGNVVSLIARTWPNSLYREGERAYRVQFSPQLPRAVYLTDWVGTILQAPREFEGRAFDIVGYYRGSNLLGEARGNPPVTKSDWVIADGTGAIYVTGARPSGLDPQSRADLWSLVHVHGVVAYVRLGTSYLQARTVEVLARSQPEMAVSPTPTSTLTPTATRTLAATATRTPTALSLPTATVSTTTAIAPMRLATRASGAR
jgi:hypothetical protein